MTVASTEDVHLNLQIVGLVRKTGGGLPSRGGSIARFRNFLAQFRSFARVVFLLDLKMKWAGVGDEMAVTVEMQNTGDSDLKADVVASIEHALADRPGDWRVSIIHFPSVIRLRTGSVRFPKSAVWAAVPASGQESAQRRAGQFPAIQKMVDEFGLHRLLQPDCARLFKDGHLNEAVRKALEKYETYVQQTSALSKIGVDLMANAFNERRRTIHSC